MRPTTFDFDAPPLSVMHTMGISSYYVMTVPASSYENRGQFFLGKLEFSVSSEIYRYTTLQIACIYYSFAICLLKTKKKPQLNTDSFHWEGKMGCQNTLKWQVQGL